MLNPLTRDMFKAHFIDCHFDEIILPSLKGEKVSLPKEQRKST